MPRLPLALVLALLVGSPVEAADIGLTPPRLILSAQPGDTVTAVFSVLTSAATEQSVESATSDWFLGVDGELAFVPPGTTPHSAAGWLALESGTFALAPSSSREVRLEVTVPEDAEGTHHAMVFFTVVPPPTDTPGVGVTTTTRVGLTVYVTVTGTERSGSELVDLYQPDPTTLAAVVVNTGNTVMRLGGAIELRNEAGDVVHRLPVPDVPVLRESEREVRFDLPDDLEPGFYVVLALIEDDRGGVLAGELPIEIP
ncbi:MAG: hypothetical protein LC667_17530 [Thioalkalivibrio sp.]|nr:hypothetical protein [Thioalkalivibrio sp.]